MLKIPLCSVVSSHSVSINQSKRFFSMRLSGFAVGILVLDMGFYFVLASALPTISHTNFREWKKRPAANCTDSSTNNKICPVNLVIAVDGSRSVKSSNFDKAKNFVNDIFTSLHTNNASFGFIVFSNDATAIFTLQNNLTLLETQLLVSSSPYPARRTLTHLAIQLAGEMFTGHASTRSKILVIITDGKSGQPKDTSAAANVVKSSGVTIFAVGVGPSLDQQELKAIASDKRYILNSTSFMSLSDIVCPIKELDCESVLMPEPDNFTSTPPNSQASEFAAEQPCKF